MLHHRMDDTIGPLAMLVDHPRVLFQIINDIEQVGQFDVGVRLIGFAEFVGEFDQ